MGVANIMVLLVLKDAKASDLFVEQQVITELKVAKHYNPKYEPQLINQLKATKIKIGLLINFGRTKVEFKRFIF